MVKAIDILVSGCDWCGWDIGFLLIVTLCQDTDFTLLSLLGLKKKEEACFVCSIYTREIYFHNTFLPQVTYRIH